MCGIFGFIGSKKNASQIVLDGLKLLEYRGYDSWGIAVDDGDKLAIDKHVGKIGDASTNLPPSSIGIGHTRWATHGGVTVANAHPHLDCQGKIAIIHNGIVENYASLKEKLLAQGHTFASETDTETIVHLIEEYAKKERFETAVRLAFNDLHGLNAVLAIDASTHEIIAAKNGSPLVIGIGEGEYYIASDASGIVKHTKKVIFMKDNEIVVLGDRLRLYSLPAGEELSAEIEIIDWDIEDADRGEYPHFMLKEIHEQPKVIRNIATNYDQQILELAKVIESAKGTFFIGSGTAFHACMTGVYLFSKVASKHVNTAAASEFNYLEDFLNKESLVIALSQSGETIDVIEPLSRAKRKGATIVGIVNALGSTIYRMSDHKLLLGAGPEKAVASTKAYIAKISMLIMLSYAIVGKLEEARKILLQAADEVERLLKEHSDEIKQLAHDLKDKEHIYIIGRGMSYPVALEAALKIKEVSYIHTEGLAGGELKHGSIALISEGTPCIVFAPHDDSFDAIISNATEIKARGGMMIGIAPENMPVFDRYIKVNNGSVASIITQSVPMQLLGYYLALEKGYDPDKPRNLAKSVTVK